MSTEKQAQLLVAWLEAHPGEHPPDGLDPEVVEAVYVLRPDLAPAPSVSVDDILARVESGPFAQSTSGAVRPRMSRTWIWGGSGLAAAAMALFLVLPMQDEVREMEMLSMESAAPASAPLDIAVPQEEKPQQEEDMLEALEEEVALDEMLMSGQAASTNFPTSASPLDNEGGPAEVTAAPEPAPAPAPAPSMRAVAETTSIDFEGVDDLMLEREQAPAIAYDEGPAAGDLSGILDQAEDWDNSEIGSIGSQGRGTGGGGYGTGGSSSSSRAPSSSARSQRSRSARTDEDFSTPATEYEDLAATVDPQSCAGPSTPLEATGTNSEETQALAVLRTQIETLRASDNAAEAASLAAERIGDTSNQVAQEFALRAAHLSLETGNIALALGYLEQGKARLANSGTYAARLLSLEGQIYFRMDQQGSATASWEAACRLQGIEP